MLQSIQDFLSKAFKETHKAQNALKQKGLYDKSLNYGFIGKEQVSTLEEYNNALFSCSIKDLIGFYVLPIDDPILGLVAFNFNNEAVYTEGSRAGVINSRALKVYEAIELVPDIFTYLKNPKPNAIPLMNGEIYEGFSSALFESKIETIELKNDKLLEELKALGQFSITINGNKIFKGSRESEKPTTITENEATFTIDGAKYQVKGLHLISPSKLKVIITVLYNQKMHTDKLDLYSFRARKSFSKVLLEELNLYGAENHLLTIQKWLENHAKQSDDEPKEIQLTEAERENAIQFLKQKDLITIIKDDIAKCGYIGESKNTLLCYLVATSRKLPSPLSAQIRSQSGAGKSYLMEKIAELINPEDILFFSRITAQSLYYMGKDGLVNKLLIIDEASGSDEAEYSIRTLQSRKKLTMAVVMKDPSTGKQKTKFFEVLGPVAYLDSSTSYSNPENENRCFTLTLDESTDQTKRIMNAQIQKRINRSEQGVKEIIHKHHNAQRVLRPLKVIIPFANKLDFPAHFLRARRDFDRFLSLIEASAFLHQYQRRIINTDEGEMIEATLADYEIAYSLQSEIIETCLTELNPLCKSVYDTIAENINRLSKETRRPLEQVDFTRKDVRLWTMKQDHVIKETMRELESLEYISKRISGTGGRYIYRLTAMAPSQLYQNTMITPKSLLEIV